MLSLFPFGVQVRKEGVNDALTTGIVGKVAHGSLPPSHFPKGPFNDVGRANDLADRRWEGEDGEQLVEVAFQTGDGFGG